MRHRNKGRHLGRNPSHRKAMLKNLASSLFLSERDDSINEAGEEYRSYDLPGLGRNPPKVKGRLVTTLQKAKVVRPLVEKCITIARRSLGAKQAAQQYYTDAERGSQEWRDWRDSQQWQDWNHAISPAVTAWRRAIKLLGNTHAVQILFDEVAPRFADRNGGYTRIVRLPDVRLGDAGTRALLEFVGVRDRVQQRSEKPAFEQEADTDAQDTPGADNGAEDASAESSASDNAPEED